jgi:YgiT-type zinc finger domain-containing protein
MIQYVARSLDPQGYSAMQQLSRCAECGGTLEQKIVTHTQPWGEQLYRFENVPALVCRQCGHVWLEAKASQAIDEIIRKQPAPRKYEQVPVCSLADALHKA